MPKAAKKPTKKPQVATAPPSRGLEHGLRGAGIAPMRLLPDLDPAKKPRWSDVSSFPHNVVVEHVRGQPRTMAPAPIDEPEATRLGRALVDKISLPWMFLGLEAIAFQWKPQAHMMTPASARLLFLGGDAAVRTELRVVDAYRGTRQAEAFAACADLGGPLAKKLMTKLAKPGSSVEKRARAWLDGDEAR